MSFVLREGDSILVGSRPLRITAELAAAFEPGDRLIGLPDSEELLHLPKSEVEIAESAVTRAVDAFATVAAVDQGQVTRFFHEFARRLEDESVFASIQVANDADVADAESRGRATTRLHLSASMRDDMIRSLRIWESTPSTVDAVEGAAVRDGLTVELVRAPLGPVAFVFEGRPNVFADATGVLRSGNTVVFRIGSDALRTAEAIMAAAVEPSLQDAGLPLGAVSLVASRSHAAGWALFSDSRLALAVARGSGPAVSQLGQIARQSGIPVSLHGTGGAWMIISDSADPSRVLEAIRWSLDRKVCNTLNVLCILESVAGQFAEAIAGAISQAAESRNTNGLVHLVSTDSRIRSAVLSRGIAVVDGEESVLASEWEWDENPELSIVTVSSLEEAAYLFNKYAPNFIVSLISNLESEHEMIWRRCEAPFVGDGFTRWVDGQFALHKPELGLSNWQFGRILARSGVLSGDSVYSVRLRARQTDINLHR